MMTSAPFSALTLWVNFILRVFDSYGVLRASAVNPVVVSPRRCAAARFSVVSLPLHPVPHLHTFPFPKIYQLLAVEKRSTHPNKPFFINKHHLIPCPDGG